jgi:hypothetical protein
MVVMFLMFNEHISDFLQVLKHRWPYYQGKEIAVQIDSNIFVDTI